MSSHRAGECPDCAQKDAALGARYRELAQLQKLLLAQQGQQARLTLQKTRLETDLAARKAALAREVAARKAAEQRLAQMQVSLSWRVTAPLRRLVRLLRRR